MANNINSEVSAKDTAFTEKRSPALVDKFVIRLPDGLRTKIKQLSKYNCRSMNAEIIMVLEKHIHQNRMSQFSDMSDFADDEADYGLKITDQQLSEKLDALPLGKKEALLELLG